MSQLVLFDRGNTGGLLVDANGIRPVPPFEPAVLSHLRAVSDLLRSAPGPDDAVSSDLASLTTKLANLAIERVEGVVGALTGDDCLVYLAEDDGFICGSTGAPPRPFPWPPVGGRGPYDLVGSGILAPDLIEFLTRSTGSGLTVTDILEDPLAAAQRIDMKLSTLAAESLKPFAPSRIESIADPVDREVVELFHRVVEDGRYVQTWTSQPLAAFKALDVEASRAAVDKILGSRAIVGRAPEVANLSIEQGIVIGIVAIIVLDQNPELQTVIDRSGFEKF
jgi:hypothetical protein